MAPGFGRFKLQSFKCVALVLRHRRIEREDLDRFERVGAESGLVDGWSGKMRKRIRVGWRLLFVERRCGG